MAAYGDTNWGPTVSPGDNKLDLLLEQVHRLTIATKRSQSRDFGGSGNHSNCGNLDSNRR